jgi:hypothetical protein
MSRRSNGLRFPTFFALALIAASGARACPPETPGRILGAWEWVRAEGGFVGGVYGPAEWGYTQQLVFAADGSVIEYRDGVERARSTWTLDCGGPEPTLTAAGADPEVFPLSTCAPHVVAFRQEGGLPSLVLRTLYCADWYDFTFVMRQPVAAENLRWGALKCRYR